jgi:predicted XRE-type DNA-binding protein
VGVKDLTSGSQKTGDTETLLGTVGALERRCVQFLDGNGAEIGGVGCLTRTTPRICFSRDQFVLLTARQTVPEGFYVYALVDPRDSSRFYYGKGSGCRKNQSVKRARSENNPHKARKIEEIREEGFEPRSEVLLCGLSEGAAYRIEERLISENFNSVTNILKVDYHRQSGEDHQHSTLTDKQASEILWLTRNTELMNLTIAEEYPCTHEVVSNIRRGAGWVSVKPKKPDPDVVSTLRSRHQKRVDQHRGENTRTASITNEKAAEIKWLANNTQFFQRVLAEVYDTTRGVVAAIDCGKSWSHLDPVKPPKNIIESARQKWEEDARRGENIPWSSLTSKEAGEIKWICENEEIILKVIAEQHGISDSAVLDIKHGRNWTHVDSRRPSESKLEDLRERHEQWERKKESLKPNSDLSVDLVSEIKWFLDNSNINQNEIARSYQVSPSSISDIKVGDTWKKVSADKPNSWSDPARKVVKKADDLS